MSSRRPVQAQKPQNQSFHAVYDLFKVTDPASFNHEMPGHSEPLQFLSESFLEDLIRCIDANLDNEQFSLEMLSRELAVSERQLQRKLKAISNKSPNRLISSVRLHRAKEWLTTNRVIKIRRCMSSVVCIHHAGFCIQVLVLFA